GDLPPFATRMTAVPFFGADILENEMVGRTVMDFPQVCAQNWTAHEMVSGRKASSLDFGVRCGDSKGALRRQRMINQVPSQKFSMRNHIVNDRLRRAGKIYRIRRAQIEDVPRRAERATTRGTAY
ncbi:MAG: hypothetical protein KAH44_18885, partial [Oricola sp.]|nr:hypothetical protein [Oricola sp.]